MDLDVLYADAEPDPDDASWNFNGVVLVPLDTGTSMLPLNWTTTVTRAEAEAETADPGYYSPPEPAVHRAFRTAKQRLGADWVTVVNGLLT